MNPVSELTPEELEQRMRAAGIAIAPNRQAMVRRLLGESLAPLRDAATRLEPIEPAIQFRPPEAPDA
jgi:hypothetical protein